MLDVPLLIGGQSLPARDGRTFERRNPVTVSYTHLTLPTNREV